MPISRRTLQATAASTETPPATLPQSHYIAQIVKPEGKNLYRVAYPASGLSKSTSTGPSAASHDNKEGSELKSGTDVTLDGKLDSCGTPQTALVELPSRFRNKIWLKRGGYVVVDRETFAGRTNKLDGEIVNVIREEKTWMKQLYWPAEFRKQQPAVDDSEEEDSLVGKMPPSSGESDGDQD